MSEKTCDGGSAYPVGSILVGGITKRDYFAAAALQGIIACFRDHAGAASVAGRVAMAYEYADAMLEARMR